VVREVGLALFLMGAGTGAGKGFLEILAQRGPVLFLWGAVMTLLPMIVGYILGKYVFKLSIFNNLGSITGGMTSTPALGTLIATAGTDDVAAAYAATYPLAMVCIVLGAKFMVMLF